jgi:uncharacterized membrane protein YccC
MGSDLPAQRQSALAMRRTWGVLQGNVEGESAAMPLSGKTKDAIKIALSISVTYAIALSMNWEKPFWAGLTVALIATTTVGQSINKGAMRLLGTLFGCLASFGIFALFPQDRWLFMAVLSVWVGFCVYLMTGPRHQYFWNITGLVTVLICVSSGPNAVDAFHTAMLRSQETGLGILVYSLVAVLIWPTDSRAGLLASAGSVATTQRELAREYLTRLCDREHADDLQKLRITLMQAQTQLRQMLPAAESDNYEIWQSRINWRLYERRSNAVSASLEVVGETIKDARKLELISLLPGLPMFQDELEQRFTQIEQFLVGQLPEAGVLTVELQPDLAEVEKLQDFERAAFEVAVSALCDLQTSAYELWKSARGLQVLEPVEDARVDNSSPVVNVIPDPDRLAASLRLIVAMWAAYLTVIYVPDLPGGWGLVTLVSVFTIIMVGTPQIPVRKLFGPIPASILFASAIYIWIMPQLSSFIGLGALIFFVTFAICYLYSAPQQALIKTFGLALFLAIASISNQQSYSILVVATTSILFLEVFVILAITSHVPFSSRPQEAIRRLIRRFFGSAAYLIGTLREDVARSPGDIEIHRRAYHLQEMLTLPQKLSVWARFLDTSVLPGTSPEKLNAMLASMQALSAQIQRLLIERGRKQELIENQAVFRDLLEWLVGVERELQALAVNPETASPATFRQRLDGVMGRLEGDIRAAFREQGRDQSSDQAGQQSYRILGCMRSVSEGLIQYAESASAIDWKPWKTERFA